MAWNLLLTLALAGILRASGLAVVDASSATVLDLSASATRVEVRDQVALTTFTDTFVNGGPATRVTYACPLPEQASATRLRWRTGEDWHEAVIGASEQQDLPGGQIHPLLLEALGTSPLHFPVPDTLQAWETLSVELEVVELLPYEFGEVIFSASSDFAALLDSPLGQLDFEFQLLSGRTITALELSSGQPGASVEVGPHAGTILWSESGGWADERFEVRYRLDLDELGLFGLGTLLPDSLVADGGEEGFLLFVAEPDPEDQVSVMSKVFTLIIDHSGSMTGIKMQQAKNAASFIVENLNEGDRFNVIGFDHWISTFQPDHVDYTPQNRDAALDFIDGLFAYGWTNISGAYNVAVPQFADEGDDTANIVLFFTDGLPSYGISDPDALALHIRGLFNAVEAPVQNFAFGVGADVNRQLLTRISDENGGFAEFLDDDELEERITAFYLRVRNPVLLQPAVEFDPPVATAIYPDPLPNLYIGQQMLVSGRYSQPVPVTVTLRGRAFGEEVVYSYELDLPGEQDPALAFLPKVWAKRKIEHLLVHYELLDPESEPAQALRLQIIELSQLWGVLSPFTSFDEDIVAIGEGPGEGPERPARLLLLRAWPNPFNPDTRLQIDVPTGAAPGLARVAVYNAIGQQVRVWSLPVGGPGLWETTWDGRDQAGRELASGIYIVVVELGGQLAVLKLTLLR
jgi:Ca-activated chloride channel homolog